MSFSNQHFQGLTTKMIMLQFLMVIVQKLITIFCYGCSRATASHALKLFRDLHVVPEMIVNFCMVRRARTVATDSVQGFWFIETRNTAMAAIPPLHQPAPQLSMTHLTCPLALLPVFIIRIFQNIIKRFCPIILKSESAGFTSYMF